MSGLRAPPRQDAPSRVVVRILFLIVLLLAAGTVIWTVATNQRIELIETNTLAGLELDTIHDVDGTAINVVQEGPGDTPVVLLHDIDVAGGVLWDQVIDALGPDVTIVAIDLPGFGFSQRIPVEDSRHTVASMAQIVSTIIESGFGDPVVFVGVGLGGEVAAEIAVTNPDLVAGLVMIDVDFYRSDGWREFVEKLPRIGPAATYALETEGPFAASLWAPRCEVGGWCPSRSQVESRDLAETIVATADSIRAFRRTSPSSLVPSKLAEVSAPTILIWSDDGDVPRESIDRVLEALPDAGLEVVNAWKAHLDEPRRVADLIRSLSRE